MYDMLKTQKTNQPLQSEFANSCIRLSLTPTEHYLCLSIKKNKLYYYFDDQLLKTYTVFTSKNPPSCIKNSFGTPWGMHKICEKIGQDERYGMVFENRIPVGKRFWEYIKKDPGGMITSRILRLEGLEQGLNKGENCDTFERFIYIHGTNWEHLIGTYFGKGCINMLNYDIIELFDLIPEKSLVWIENPYT